MLSKIKEKLRNKDTKVLISNFSYLSIIEISNYILPFLSIPYIVKVVGIENYGIVSFVLAVVAFFNIITDFGFKLLATKYISINRDDINKVSKYFWTVISAQIILLILSFLILLLLISTVDKFNQEKIVFIYAFGMVIGNILFPIWFFQGMEQMKYISIFNVINRVFYTVLIFTTIKSMDDYIYIPLYNSLGYLLISIISLYFIRKKYNLKFVLASYHDIKQLYIDGWHLFLATLSNSLYTSMNMIVLGFLTNYTVVGVLTLATTITSAAAKIIKTFSSVTFPYIAKFSNDKELMISKARVLLRIYSGLLIITCIVTFFIADPLITILFGEDKQESILMLQLLSITLIFEPLGGFFTPYLVIKNQTKTVSKITFMTMLVNFVFIIPLILLFQGLGFVATRIIVECFQVAMNVAHNKELVFKRVNKTELEV
jgi:PST family polysaccharide transporter